MGALTKMHDISVMQFGQTPQTCFQYLLPSWRGDRFAHQTKEVIFQVPEYENALIRDAVAR
jgi:hypothetical protein